MSEKFLIQHLCVGGCVGVDYMFILVNFNILCILMISFETILAHMTVVLAGTGQFSSSKINTLGKPCV